MEILVLSAYMWSYMDHVILSFDLWIGSWEVKVITSAITLVVIFDQHLSIIDVTNIDVTNIDVTNIDVNNIDKCYWKSCLTVNFYLQWFWFTGRRVLLSPLSQPEPLFIITRGARELVLGGMVTINVFFPFGELSRSRLHPPKNQKTNSDHHFGKKEDCTSNLKEKKP